MLVSNLEVIFRNLGKKGDFGAKFGPNFENALILLKICNQDNWMMLVSNLEVIFRNLGKKRGFWGQFGPNFQNALILLKICNQNNSDWCWFQILRSFLIIWAKRGFRGQIWSKFWKCSDFAENLHSAQINRADFKSGSHFSKYSRQKFFFRK